MKKTAILSLIATLGLLPPAALAGPNNDFPTYESTSNYPAAAADHARLQARYQAQEKARELQTAQAQAIKAAAIAKLKAMHPPLTSGQQAQVDSVSARTKSDALQRQAEMDRISHLSTQAAYAEVMAKKKQVLQLRAQAEASSAAFGMTNPQYAADAAKALASTKATVTLKEKQMAALQASGAVLNAQAYAKIDQVVAQKQAARNKQVADELAAAAAANKPQAPPVIAKQIQARIAHRQAMIKNGTGGNPAQLQTEINWLQQQQQHWNGKWFTGY